MKVNAATFEELPESPHPKIKWEYQIVEGEFENRRIWQTQALSEKGCRFVYQNLNNLGQNVEDPRDLLSALQNVIDQRCTATVKQQPNERDPSKPFYNVYVSADEPSLPF